MKAFMILVSMALSASSLNAIGMQSATSAGVSGTPVWNFVGYQVPGYNLFFFYGLSTHPSFFFSLRTTKARRSLSGEQRKGDKKQERSFFSPLYAQLNSLFHTSPEANIPTRSGVPCSVRTRAVGRYLLHNSCRFFTSVTTISSRSTLI